MGKEKLAKAGSSLDAPALKHVEKQMNLEGKKKTGKKNFQGGYTEKGKRDLGGKLEKKKVAKAGNSSDAPALRLWRNRLNLKEKEKTERKNTNWGLHRERKKGFGRKNGKEKGGKG